MHQNVKCGGGGAGGWGANRISNLAHIIFAYDCLYRFHKISAKWPTTDLTILVYSGCDYMQKYDHIKGKIVK